MELKAKKINKDAKLPQYGHKGDAGLDLFSSTNFVLAEGQVEAIPTGIKIAVPEGYVGLIWDKSGVSLKGVHRLAGVIDSGYRGEVKVVMINLSNEPYVIDRGMKIAQMLVQPITIVDVVEMDDLDDTSRGEGGFGSTGKF
ncbi:MAG: dUTP diphosphatase [Candidatus Aminicenantes bacterium]|nr:MAG: dUTP diphosphatase [Candidatus Aminicenantes bacterium]